jgi:exosortase
MAPGGRIAERVFFPLAPWLAAIGALGRRDIGAALDLALHHATYRHCLLVPAASLVLIWARRGDLASATPRFCRWGLAGFAASTLAWWIGPFAELRQLAVVAMALSAILAVLGPQLCRRMAFPLLYLFLMVPAGTPLVRPLQLATLWLTDGLLALSGIPSTVDGILVAVPLRVYAVEPGCAGLNFLLAATALAPLYAWRFYAGWRKRLAAMAVAMGLAVLANGVRVWGMIALAEFTDARIDLGPQDHLIHGWVFFSAVMAAAMAVGLRYEDA